jgi:hypothetical protein
MRATRSTTRALVAMSAALAFIGAACSDDAKSTTTTTPATTGSSAPATTGGTGTTAAPGTTVAAGFEGELVGTFAITEGDCTSGVAGSWFQMQQADGSFVPNADSLCTADPTYSLLAPGTDGGLITGAFQSAPDPAYDATGNGLAAAIAKPVKFFGVDFAAATAADGTQPTLTATNGVLTGDLSAFTAYYGGQAFNQGAPKPDGTGSAPTGTIDPTTGAFVIEWTSLISGGSFDGFTGVWHLEGTFTPGA